MLFDTHSHLNFRAFDSDRDEVAQKCLEQSVWLINVGSNYATSKMAVEMAEKYEKGVWAAVGLHPINIKSDREQFSITSYPQGQKNEDDLEDDFDFEKYKELAKSSKVVAIGEIGLDANNEPMAAKEKDAFWQKQKEVFLAQLQLAKEFELPVILHCRKAHEELSDILVKTMKQWSHETMRAVVHCFTGNWKQAQEYLVMGLYLGFNGIIFKLDLDEVIAKTPLERILVETDCPFLTPPLARRSSAESGTEAAASAEATASQRNEPINVKYVIQKIAEIKKTTFDQVAKTATQNAKTLFSVAD